MRYLLTVLTNGRRDCYVRALNAFFELASPAPAEMFIFDDGHRTDVVNEEGDDLQAQIEWSDEPIGMCAAHARCWQAARETGCDWVFHLEDDMVLLRPLDLRALAAVMDREASLVQMALVRTPWGREVEHGGYVPQSPSWYERRSTTARFGARYEWIAQRRNWTASPCLFRPRTAALYDWPAEPGCETEIGPAILERRPGALFGLWGGGECQVAHVGVERAEGSHGY